MNCKQNELYSCRNQTKGIMNSTAVNEEIMNSTAVNEDIMKSTVAQIKLKI